MKENAYTEAQLGVLHCVGSQI